jgi:hypothetical protein
LDLLAGLQVEGCGQRQGDIYKKPGRAALGADDLNLHHIFCLHIFRLLYRLA